MTLKEKLRELSEKHKIAAAYQVKSVFKGSTEYWAMFGTSHYIIKVDSRTNEVQDVQDVQGIQ